MYVPLMIGCRCGRGETVISIWGCAAAKRGRVCLRKELWRGKKGGLLDGGGGVVVWGLRARWGRGGRREEVGEGRDILHAA